MAAVMVLWCLKKNIKFILAMTPAKLAMKKRIISLMCACALACSMSTWSQAAGTPGKEGPQLKPLTKEQALKVKKNTEKRCNDLKNEMGRTCPDPRQTGRCHRAKDELKNWQRGGGCR